MKLYRANGQLVQEFTFEGLMYTLDMQSFEPGLYFIRLENEQGISVLKLLAGGQ